MRKINLIKAGFGLSDDERLKDLSVENISSTAYCKVIGIKIKNGARLKKHKADVPISVFCQSGSGTFSAGSDLDELVALTPGTMLMLEPGIEHEVTAQLEVGIIVTKFLGEPTKTA